MEKVQVESKDIKELRKDLYKLIICQRDIKAALDIARGGVLYTVWTENRESHQEQLPEFALNSIERANNDIKELVNKYQEKTEILIDNWDIDESEDTESKSED